MKKVSIVVACRDWFTLVFVKVVWHCVGLCTKMGSALNILGLVSKQESKTAERRKNQSETWQEREE